MPVYVTQSFMYSEDFARGIASCFNEVPVEPLCDGVQMHLWEDPDFVPVPHTPVEDYEAAESLLDGYSAISITLNEPVNIQPDCDGAIGSALFQVTPATPSVTSTIYGYWLQASGGVIGAERFPNGQAVPLAEHGDWLQVVTALPIHSYQATAPDVEE